ncbi:MAG: relaxase/mobilization nuclease domain-containing protein [Eubacterium sp.]|nr:relaxase/mobilization nuclease domain-containing protein [Eubacterium sp.]
MATVGLWPVKSHLRDVIKYADNPDKTVDKRYLDKDLADIINYAANPDKTDKQMYVSAINCPDNLAYEFMMATKRRFGKVNGNLAYHGFQSFVKNEVTPKEAHEIGMETAKKMWGDRYEVVVTTHLNASHLHNHFVVNSVSFIDGKKFQNKISDHIRLREISDEICFEHGKSVLQNKSIYAKESQGEYWAHHKGQLTHRDMLRADVEEALNGTVTVKDFEVYMECLGYEFIRNFRYDHPSIKAPEWSRAVRLDSLGRQYTKGNLIERLDRNMTGMMKREFIRTRAPRMNRRPMLMILRRRKYEPNLITLVFELFITLVKVCKGNIIENREQRPISPAMRAEVRRLDETLQEYHFLKEHQIEAAEDFAICREKIEKDIHSLEEERQHIRNRIRRAKPEVKEQLKAEAKDITKQLTPMRMGITICNRIEDKYKIIQQLIEQERRAELGISRQRKEFDYDR